jgi:CRP-like cAMP-binding protein
MPHSKNRILARVNTVDLKDLEPHLRLVQLQHGRILADARQRIHNVYFPHEGILSSVVELKTGWGIETGMIGNDGVFGGAQAIGHRMSLNQVMVQVPGWATVVNADVIRDVADASPDFRGLLVKYEQFFLAQVQQTTACNALHSVEQRMCKWLVRMYDLVGTDLPLTQEFLAQMMGVRRPSVTGVAIQMQNEGLISYRRGKVQILNIDLIQKRGCECPHTVREHYVEMFGSVGEPPAFPIGSGIEKTPIGD